MFPKDGYNSILHPMCAPAMWSCCSSIKGSLVSSSWARLCDMFVINKTCRSEASWFLKLGQWSPCSFCLFSWQFSFRALPFSLLLPNHHVVRRQSQMERPWVWAPDNTVIWAQSLSLDSCTHVKKSPYSSPAVWITPGMGVFPAEFPDTMEHRQTVMVSFKCQIWLVYSIQ